MVAVLDIDPFSPAFLDDPFPAHAAMRDAGPLVFLPSHRIHAAARWQEVHAMLNDWQSYCSSRGVGLADFAREPPWRPPSLVLEADPPAHTRARAVLEEALRLESPVQTFFRTTTRPVELDGIALGEGQKVLLFLGAANRDPRRWERPDEYDLTRRTAGHVAFGSGIHMCVGQLLSRLEGEALLAALARQVATITLAGASVRHQNNTLRALRSLPLRLIG
jgi:cytochrome P450